MQIKSSNIMRVENAVSTCERNKLNGHESGIVNFSGLSEHRKLNLMSKLENQLFHLGLQVVLINNSIVRNGLSLNLGYSKEDKLENVRRATELAILMSEAGWIVLADFHSCGLSEKNSHLFLKGKHFYEIYLGSKTQNNTPQKLTQAKKKSVPIEKSLCSNIPDQNRLIIDTEIYTDTELTNIVIDFIAVTFRSEKKSNKCRDS